MTQPRLQEPIVERIASAPLDARLTGTDGAWTLTMHRVFAHPPTAVWPMLTDPERLAQWSPLVPDRTLDSTGAATSRETPDADPVDATVLSVDAPRELVHRWGEATLRWTLVEVPDGTELTLEHDFGDRALGPAAAGGWHVCFATLDAVLGGAATARVVGDDAMNYGWQDLHDSYADAFATVSG